MRETYEAITDAIWRHLGHLAPSAPEPQQWFVDTPHAMVGPQLGREGRRRIAVGRPVEGGDGWVCHVLVEGRTTGPVAVPGRGPVDAFVNAMRIVGLALDEWVGLPHIGADHAQAAGSFGAFDPTAPRRIGDVLASDRWRVGEREHDVVIGDLVRGPAGAGAEPTACFVDIEGVTDGPIRALQLGGPARSLVSAAEILARFMLGSSEASAGGRSLAAPYDAVTEAIWRGVASLASSAPPIGEVVAEETWDHGLHFGHPSVRRLRVGAPVQHSAGWVCHVDIEGRTAGPLPVAGRGPVDSLIHAMRIVGLDLSEWAAWPPDPGDADDPVDAGETREPPGRDWRAPEVSEVPDVIAEDRWQVGGRVHRVAVGRPHPNPNDPDATWVCYAHVEGWVGPTAVYGVGPVDTLRNAARLAAGFLHLHDVARVTA